MREKLSWVYLVSTSILVLGLVAASGCQSPETEPQSAFTHIRPGMSQSAFLAAIPEDVAVVQQEAAFVTVEYTEDDSGARKASHVWFVDGGLLTVPQKKTKE